jgi:hypothetical protein
MCSTPLRIVCVGSKPSSEEATVGVDLHIDEGTDGNRVELADFHDGTGLRLRGEIESLPEGHIIQKN